jgi:hypothetical protein
MSQLITPEQIAASGSERAHQTALFCWSALESRRVPELRLLFAIPNEGRRGRIEGGQLKAAGLRPGVPDVFLPIPRRGMHGLWLELKVKGNRTTPVQDKWIRDLKGQGYAVRVAYSWLEARESILEYLQAGS